ncbi:MAG TPA: hypothetical protein VFY93_02040 [Planctomycetota bacterium]|nr:hypothetical protein [Planctomycetota bacterium]
MAGTKEALRRITSRFDGVVEGVACAGTKIESKTYAVRGRAFLFVGAAEPTVVRFKVGASAAAAKKAGAEVGAGGWAKIVLDGALPAGLDGLVAESYSLAGGGKAPAGRAARSTTRKRKAKRK